MKANDVARQGQGAALAARLLAATLLAAAACSAGAAVMEGRTSAGHRYVAGGIGVEEADAMRAQAPAYSLQVIMAAKSGAYLAGTQVRIAGPGNAVILDTTIDAPWLLVDLPAGHYTVRATHSGTTVQRSATITPGKTQRVVFQFDVPVDNEGPARAPGAERWLPQ